MKRLFWPATWAVAIVALSQTIHAGKVWRQEHGVGSAAVTLLWLALLSAAIWLLTLRMYARERALGRVARPVGCFERILERGADGE